MAQATPRRNEYEQKLAEETVYKMLLGGYSNKMIKDELIRNHNYKTDSAAKYCINKVIKSFKMENRIEELKDKYVEMYLNLYRTALLSDDVRVAKGVLDSITKLQGMLTQKMEVETKETFEVKFE